MTAGRVANLGFGVGSPRAVVLLGFGRQALPDPPPAIPPDAWRGALPAGTGGEWAGADAADDPAAWAGAAAADSGGEWVGAVPAG